MTPEHTHTHAHERINRGIFWEEDGFSTVGMVIALLLTLSLIFTSAQVYRVESASAEIQNVADAAVLSAQNGVAEFYVAVRVCDAIVLSMTLTSLAAAGIGLVALCVPPIASIGSQFIEASSKMIEARNSFAERASEALNYYQALLPYLCAVEAATTASANSDDVAAASYFGLALLVPFDGKEITVGSAKGAEALVEAAQEKEDEIAEAAAEAEEATQEANEQKEKAYMADCGNAPGYCMYERADTLANLSASENPLYQSMEAWSFDVALKRAQAYYAARLASEAPEDSSIEEQVRSVMRTRFYQYASDELAQGYVHDDGTSFDAYFPQLPRNTQEMRETELYTEKIYPITTDDSGTRIMHAWSGCPEASGASDVGSIEQMESGGFSTCATCGFTAASLGRVASASTSIENGFEYHYAIVAEAAEAYEEARDEAEPYTESVKSDLTSLFEDLSSAFVSAASYRIEAEPPGRYGSLAFVVSTEDTDVAEGFASLFVSEVSPLGLRMALSAASLAEDDAEEGKTIISSLLENVANQGLFAVVDVLADLWSALLYAYAEGSEGLIKGVRSVLDGLPLLSESGLGSWAEKALSSALDALGLEPVDLSAPKPVLVNSAHVLSVDTTTVSETLLLAKQGTLAAGDLPDADDLNGILDYVEQLLGSGSGDGSDLLEIATVALSDGSGLSFIFSLVFPLSTSSGRRSRAPTGRG